MTAPRFVVPGQTYLLTRRCSERRFFLRPDDRTNHLFLYCLAEAAERFRVVVVAWVAMSNHYHAVVEDPHGVLPEFLCHFHKMTARALNVHWRRRENLWAAEHASVVRLVEQRDVLDKVVYALANPVHGFLVERALEWPGPTSFAALDGRVLRLARPRTYFKDDGAMPPVVSLQARVPTGWSRGRVAWAEAVRDGVRQKEIAALRERAATARRVVGRRAILAAHPGSRPTTLEPRRDVRPEVACGDPARRVAELHALSGFRAAYATARELFIRGFEALFPWGTYKLVRELGATCAPAPT